MDNARLRALLAVVAGSALAAPADALAASAYAWFASDPTAAAARRAGVSA